MANKRRIHKMAERVRSAVAMQVLRLSDPRFHLVTITAAHVTSDLRLAKIYWTVTGGENRAEEVEEAFESAKGLIRRELAPELGVKFVPDLKFFYDDTLDIVEKTRDLLSQVPVREDDAQSSNE